MKCSSTGKIRHVDKAAAQAAKARLPYGNELQPYHCPSCEGWHLGGHHRRRESKDVLAQAHLWPTTEAAPIGGTTIGDRIGDSGCDPGS